MSVFDVIVFFFVYFTGLPRHLHSLLPRVFFFVMNAQEINDAPVVQQLDLFTNVQVLQQKEQEQEADRQKERRQLEAMLQIRQKFGKNAILKGMNLEEGATGRDRNNQIGGHRA